MDIENKEFRCIECGEYHDGDCDIMNCLVFAFLITMDYLDEIAGYPPEPSGRRWLIEQGEYPSGVFPSGIQ